MLSLKNGVSLATLQPQAVLAATIVYSIYESRNQHCIITSANDGVHKPNSLHKAGRAFDVRTKHLPNTGEKTKIRDLCKLHLGAEFDVILESIGGENEHLHIEWDPKST